MYSLELFQIIETRVNRVDIPNLIVSDGICVHVCVCVVYMYTP